MNAIERLIMAARAQAEHWEHRRKDPSLSNDGSSTDEWDSITAKRDRWNALADQALQELKELRSHGA